MQRDDSIMMFLILYPSCCQMGAHQYADSQGPSNIDGPVYGDELDAHTRFRHMKACISEPHEYQSKHRIIE